MVTHHLNKNFNSEKSDQVPLSNDFYLSLFSKREQLVLFQKSRDDGARISFKCLSLKIIFSDEQPD